MVSHNEPLEPLEADLRERCGGAWLCWDAWKPMIAVLKRVRGVTNAKLGGHLCAILCNAKALNQTEQRPIQGLAPATGLEIENLNLIVNVAYQREDDALRSQPEVGGVPVEQIRRQEQADHERYARDEQKRREAADPATAAKMLAFIKSQG
jgi:hypothetical protein